MVNPVVPIRNYNTQYDFFNCSIITAAVYKKHKHSTRQCNDPFLTILHGGVLCKICKLCDISEFLLQKFLIV